MLASQIEVKKNSKANKSKPMTQPDKKVAAFIMKDHLFEISMLCKEQGWHKSGMLICAASDELEKMLDEGRAEQERYVLTKR